MKKILAAFSLMILISCQGKKEDAKKNYPDFKIIRSYGNKIVTNLHVFIGEPLSDSSLTDFILKLKGTDRKKNIFIYNDSTIGYLVEKYPLDTSEFIKVADHLLAESYFDADSVVTFWPMKKDPLYVRYKDAQ